MLLTEQKKIVRRAAEEAIAATVDQLDHWLSVTPKHRTFPTAAFSDILQALAVLKAVGE